MMPAQKKRHYFPIIFRNVCKMRPEGPPAGMAAEAAGGRPGGPECGVDFAPRIEKLLP